MNIYQVVWTQKAAFSLERLYYYIAEQSPANAKKVKLKILQTAKSLSKNPERFQADEYYPENQGTIRRVFCWNFKLQYEIMEEHVFILNIMHTRSNSTES